MFMRRTRLIYCCEGFKMKHAYTHSFITKALRIKRESLVTSDHFNTHELLEWAMYFACQAGHAGAEEWYNVHPGR